MELGNLLFGNSRGHYEVSRSLVDSEEWTTLVHRLIQVEDYHCSMGEYFQDYDDDLTYKTRENHLEVSEFGGYICKNENDEILFEIFPYYWDDCTCGADEYNYQLEEKLLKEIMTKKERKIFNKYEKSCDYNCAAFNVKGKLKDKKDICTCGRVKKNIKLKKQKKKLREKEKQYYKMLECQSKQHEDNCLVLKHNFVYHPGKEDEFWIDWYKYPFRDSYCNVEKTDEQIKEIFVKCQEYVKQDIKRHK